AHGVRASQPFIAINCGAIPDELVESELFGHRKGAFTGAVADKEGVFVAANGGTVFLDEVGEIPLNQQVNLLRVIQQREVRPVGGNEMITFDTRIIAAANKNLEKEVEEGRFRDDLFYRLNVVEIALPVLQERQGDIPLLARHFMEKYSRKLNRPVKGINREAMEALVAYEWKGQVRELENIIERAVLLGEDAYISLNDLPANMAGLSNGSVVEVAALDKAVQLFEQQHIQRMLKRCGGNKTKTAGLLGIDPSTLYRKMEKMGIS